MADTFITQCPHCGTSFRVKDDQLAVANGSVRCGACLQVFSARNHVVNGKPAPKRSATKAAGSPPSRQTPARPGATQESPPKPAPAARKHRAEPPPIESEFEADKDDDADFIFADDPDEDDEFIFQDSDDDLFSGDGDGDDSEMGELSDSFINLNSPQPDKRRADPFQHETQSIERELFDDTEEDDESWAESILDELEREEKQTQTPRFEAREPSPKRSGGNEKARQTEYRQPEDSPEPAMQARAEPSMGSRASQLVRHLNHEIDLDFNVEERLARWRWLGGLFAVVLMLTLAAQVAWLQKDTYARMDQWRGLYESACNVLGCSLPAQEDLDQIRASNVLVRDHKVLDDVKLLDAILTNRAPFKQPFPVLVLQYTNVNGDLVADQAFHPDDYLRGELTGTRLMPINTRVYVSIPLRDPGEGAVNYQLLLTAPS